MGFFKTVFGGMKDRVKAVDNLTKQINDGDLVVDRKNLEIKKNDEKKTEKNSLQKIIILQAIKSTLFDWALFFLIPTASNNHVIA